MDAIDEIQFLGNALAFSSVRIPDSFEIAPWTTTQGFSPEKGERLTSFRIYSRIVTVALLTVMGSTLLCGAIVLCLAAAIYGAARPPLSQSKVKEIRENINKIITESSNGRSMIFIPGFVRLCFHDCVGHCDGCINLKNPDNAGLGRYIDGLQLLYNEKEYDAVISLADFWMLAGIEAVSMGSEMAGMKLDIPFRWGRKDCASAPSADVMNKYPDAHGAIDHVLGFFSKEFGLNAQETTALMGAHTLGRCSSAASGFEGPWVAREDAFDNAYYKDLLLKNWTQSNIHAATPSVAQRWQWNRDDDPTFMMLNSDMAFIKNLTVKQNGETTCSTTSTCPDLHSNVHAHVVEYSKNNEAWYKDFANAFLKMIENVAPEVYVTLKDPVPDTTTGKQCDSSGAVTQKLSVVALVVTWIVLL